MYIASGRDPVIVKVPLYGAAADIADGALIMPGSTAETDLGLFIVATNSAAGADALGVLRGTHDYSVVGDSAVAGTSWVWGEVQLCDQYTPIWVEYDQSDTAAVASTSSTTVTITSLEDNIDTSYLVKTDGAGTCETAFLTASASGSATSKTATGWSAADTVIKVLRLGHQVAKLNTGATKIGTDAGAGSWTVFVLENWFKADGYPLTMLDPTKHDNLSLTGASFYAKIIARNTAGHTTE